MKYFFVLCLCVSGILFSHCSEDAPTTTDPLIPTEGQIVFVGMPDGIRSIYKINSDGTNRSLLFKIPEGLNYVLLGEQQISPDGEKILLSKASSKTQLYLQSTVENAIEVAISSDSKILHRVAWSLDSKHFLWVERKDGPGTALSSIFSMSADGKNKQLVVQDTGIGTAVWAPDKMTIVYSSIAGIKSVDIDGKNKKLIKFLPAEYGSSILAFLFSPDGQQIAFDDRRYDTTQVLKPGLFVINKDGTNLRKLTGGAAFDNFLQGWTSDNRKLVLYHPKSASISTINTDGSDMKLIQKGANADLSPDGKNIVYDLVGSENGLGTVYIASIDGSKKVKLTDNGYNPKWIRK